MDLVAQRFEVYLIALEPTVSSEIQKTRPCTIVSPNEMNTHLAMVIVAPMTTGGRAYPTRVPCQFQGTQGYVALDQLHTVDQTRLLRKLGELNPDIAHAVLATLAEMFAA